MSEQAVIIQEAGKVSVLAQQAIDAVVNGDVDPVQTYIAIRRMEKAIELFKENPEVNAIVQAEIEKYGKDGAAVGDCTLKIKEAGVRYDFKACNDRRYEDLLSTEKAASADRKDREKFLKGVPAAGQTVVNEDTGEVFTIYPPAKSSKTTIETTFKK